MSVTFHVTKQCLGRSSLLACLVVAASALGAPHALGQSVYEWIQVQGPSPPEDRRWELGYDAAQQVILACSRSGPHEPDTWMWDGSVWTNTGFHGPTYVNGKFYYPASGLVFHDHVGAVYRVQMFHSVQPMTTWVFITNVGWVQVDSDGPISSMGFGWAYDTARQMSVMFGGVSGGGGVVPAFTWEWDGFTWTRHDPHPEGPENRYSTAMAYDRKNGVAVMFGGLGEAGRLGDTWTWDGVQWQQHAVSGPSPRSQHAMTYDTVREKVLLFGGYTGDFMNDLWEWNGTSWTQIPMTGGPNPRSQAGFTYDDARREAVLYSGFGTDFPHTWLLRVRETWVDFNHNGSETGTFSQPFNTLAEAVQTAPADTIVNIKPGSTSEVITISKKLRISAPLGTATIG